jgi:hypothetical protein
MSYVDGLNNSNKLDEKLAMAPIWLQLRRKRSLLGPNTHENDSYESRAD